jgi:hypothetical protein
MSSDTLSLYDFSPALRAEAMASYRLLFRRAEEKSIRCHDLNYLWTSYLVSSYCISIVHRTHLTKAHSQSHQPSFTSPSLPAARGITMPTEYSSRLLLPDCAPQEVESFLDHQKPLRTMKSQPEPCQKCLSRADPHRMQYIIYQQSRLQGCSCGRRGELSVVLEGATMCNDGSKRHLSTRLPRHDDGVTNATEAHPIDEAPRPRADRAEGQAKPYP